MSDEHIIDEEAIFSAAVAIDEADQQLAYLRQACGGDAALLARMEALLKSPCQPEQLHRAGGQLAATDDRRPRDRRRPRHRDRPVQAPAKRSAKAAWRSSTWPSSSTRSAAGSRSRSSSWAWTRKNVIARFEAERQALALMDHPNIAKVFDGGATDTGRPYFVMELVRGVSITDYCDQNRLNTRERLELFVQVCNAVQHAHQKGIIHRDIKPSNVMVTLHDGKPVPKVIDFGIAKATNQRLTEQTLFTRYAQMIGTPEYMSPEQAEMSGLDIDTRTDIYSLGVLLYELLTGVDALCRRDAPRRRLRGDAADHPRDRSAEALDPDSHAGPDAERCRPVPAEQSRAAAQAGQGRPRLDRDEDPGKGPDAPVRDGPRPGRGHRAAPAARADPGRLARRGVSRAEVPAPPPHEGGHLVGRRGRSGRSALCRRHLCPLQHPADPQQSRETARAGRGPAVPRRIPAGPGRDQAHPGEPVRRPQGPAAARPHRAGAARAPRRHRAVAGLAEGAGRKSRPMPTFSWPASTCRATRTIPGSRAKRRFTCNRASG